MPVQIKLKNIQTTKLTTAKCDHCGKYMEMHQLQKHIQEIQRIKKSEEDRKKAEEILKKEKDLRAIIKQKDLRTKLKKIEEKKNEEAKNKKKLNSAVRSHYIKTLRSDL